MCRPRTPAYARRWHKMGDKCIPAAPNQLLTGILASIMQSSCLFQAQSCGQCGMRPPLHVCSPRCRLRCLRPNEGNSFVRVKLNIGMSILAAENSGSDAGCHSCGCEEGCHSQNEMFWLYSYLLTAECGLCILVMAA